MCTSTLRGRVQQNRYLSAFSKLTLETFHRVTWSQYHLIIGLIASLCLAGIAGAKLGFRWSLMYPLFVRKLLSICYLRLYLVTWRNRKGAETERLVALTIKYSIPFLCKDPIVPHPYLFYWRLRMSNCTTLFSHGWSCLQMFLCGIDQMDTWRKSSVSCLERRQRLIERRSPTRCTSSHHRA